jgi:hypothetical protein
MENNSYEYNFDIDELDAEQTRIDDEDYIQYEDDIAYKKALAVSDVEESIKRVSGDVTGDPFSYIQKAARSGEIKFANEGSLTLNSKRIINQVSIQEIRNLENPLPDRRRRYSSTFDQVKNTGGFISRPKVEDYQSIFEIDETFRGSFFQLQQRDVLKSLLTREKRTELAYQEADITNKQKQGQENKTEEEKLKEEENEKTRASILSPNKVTENIIKNRTDNKNNILLNPVISEGSFHPKIAVVGDIGIVGTQNLTSALAGNKSIESLLVFKKDENNPRSVGSVVVDELNQTLDSIFKTKKEPAINKALDTSLNTNIATLVSQNIKKTVGSMAIDEIEKTVGSLILKDIKEKVESEASEQISKSVFSIFDNEKTTGSLTSNELNNKVDFFLRKDLSTSAKDSLNTQLNNTFTNFLKNQISDSISSLTSNELSKNINSVLSQEMVNSFDIFPDNSVKSEVEYFSTEELGEAVKALNTGSLSDSEFKDVVTYLFDINKNIFENPEFKNRLNTDSNISNENISEAVKSLNTGNLSDSEFRDAVNNLFDLDKNIYQNPDFLKNKQYASAAKYIVENELNNNVNSELDYSLIKSIRSSVSEKLGQEIGNFLGTELNDNIGGVLSSDYIEEIKERFTINENESEKEKGNTISNEVFNESVNELLREELNKYVGIDITEDVVDAIKIKVKDRINNTVADSVVNEATKNIATVVETKLDKEVKQIIVNDLGKKLEKHIPMGTSTNIDSLIKADPDAQIKEVLITALRQEVEAESVEESPLKKTDGYIYSNEDILPRINSALETAASGTDKVIISMGEISALLYGKDDPTGLKANLLELAKKKQLTLVTDSNRLNEKATKDSSVLEFINQLQEVSEGTAVTTAVTNFLHDKSIGIFNQSNELQFIFVGSANFSEAALLPTETGRPINTEVIAAVGTGNYVDKNRTGQDSEQASDYLNNLTKSGSLYTHFNTLSGGSLDGTNLFNTGYLADRSADVTKVESLKNELLALNKAIAGDSDTNLITITDRLGPSKTENGKLQTVGLKVEISGLGGLHRTSIDLTVNEEGNIILTNTNKILGKSLFVNKSEVNKNIFGTDLKPGSSKILSAEETAVSFVGTIARELSYQGTESLVNSVYQNMYHKDFKNEIAGKAASNWLASVFNEVDPNIVVKGTQIGSSIKPNFGSLAHFLSQDSNDMLNTTSAVIKHIAEGKFAGGNKNLTQEQISERFSLLDLVFRNFDNPYYENSAAYDVSQDLVHLLANDSTGLLTDIKLSLLKEDPEFSKALKQAAATQSKEITNLLAAPFLAAHESRYSSYQADTRLPVFGTTESSTGNTVYDRVVEAGLLDPITVRHGTKIGKSGQFVRLVASTAYQTDGKLPGYGGIRQLKTVDSDISTGAAVVNELDLVYKSTPNLVAITRAGQEKTIKKMLVARSLILNEEEDKELNQFLEKRLSTNLYYQPFPSAEQIPQRLKNLFGQRPAVSFDRKMIKTARNMGVVKVENSEDIMGGRLREVLPAQQYAELAALKEELEKEDKTVTYEDLQKVYREREANVHTTKRGFIGPERMKRVLLNSGISSMGDYSYGNAGYDEETGSITTFKIKVKQDALVNVTEAQEIITKAFKPGAIASYTDITVSDEDAVAKIIKTYNLDEPDGQATTTVNDVEALTDPVKLLKQKAKTYNELLKASNKEGSKDIIFRIEDDKIVATYKAGLYSPNEDGVLTKVGDFEEKGLLRIKGLNQQRDTPTGKRLEPIRVKLPTFNKRFESGISIITSPVSLTTSQGSLLVEGTVATAHKPGSGSRPTGPVKGPIEYISPKLFTDAKDKRGGEEYQKYVPQAIKSEDYYGMHLTSLYKGFPADSGLYLLSQEDSRNNLANASGEEIARSLSLLFLGDKELKQALRINLNESNQGLGQISAALRNVKGIDISKTSVHKDTNLGQAALGLLMLAEDEGLKKGLKDFGLEPVKALVKKALGKDPEAKKARKILEQNTQALFKLIDENSIQLDDGRRIISEGDTLNRGGGLLAHTMFFGNQLFNLSKSKSLKGVYERDLSDVIQYKNNESYKQVVDMLALSLDIELDQKDDKVLGRQLKMLQAFQENDVMLEAIVDTTVSQSLVPAGMKDDVRLEFQYLVGMSSKYLKAFEPIGGAGEDSQTVQQALMLISSAIKGGLSAEQRLSYKLAVVGEGDLNITTEDIKLRRFLLTNTSIARKQRLSDSFIEGSLGGSYDEQTLNKIERIYQESTTIEDSDARIRALNLTELGVGYFSSELDNANEKQLNELTNMLGDADGITSVELLDVYNEAKNKKVKVQETIKTLTEEYNRIEKEIIALENTNQTIKEENKTEQENKTKQKNKNKRKNKKVNDPQYAINNQQIKDKRREIRQIKDISDQEKILLKEADSSIDSKKPTAFNVVNTSLLKAYEKYQDYVKEQRRAYELSTSFGDYIKQATDPNSDSFDSELDSFNKINEKYNIISDITDERGNLRGRIETALEKSNRRVIERIEETINKSAADTYLDNVLNLEADIIKRKQAQETTQETRIELETRLKDLQTSKQIVLPHYRVEAVMGEEGSEGLYRVKVYSPEDIAPTIGVLLGTDILRNTSLVFGDYKDDLLTKQVELVENLYKLEELTNRVFANPDAVVTAETVQQLDSLRDSIEASRLALVQQLDTNVVRKAFGDQQNYKGATGIATASFGLDNDQVLVGKRFSDWQSGDIKPQELLLNQLRLIEASDKDGSSAATKAQHIKNLITLADQFRSTGSIEGKEKVSNINLLTELNEKKSIKKAERLELDTQKSIKKAERLELDKQRKLITRKQKDLPKNSIKEPNSKAVIKDLNRQIRKLKKEQSALKTKKGSDAKVRKKEITNEIKSLENELKVFNLQKNIKDPVSLENSLENEIKVFNVQKNIKDPVSLERKRIRGEIKALDNEIEVLDNKIKEVDQDAVSLDKQISVSENIVKKRSSSEISPSTQNLKDFLNTYGGKEDSPNRHEAVSQLYSYMTGLPMDTVSKALTEKDGIENLNELLTVPGKSGVRRSGAPAGAGALVADNIAYELKSPQSINNRFEEKGERVNLLEIDNERFATGMKVPAMSRLLAGLGDYDGDTYQILMNRMSSTSQGILEVQNELISKQSQLEQVNSLLDYRTNIKDDEKDRLIQEKYDRYVNALEQQEQQNITAKDKQEQLQTFSKEFDEYTETLKVLKQENEKEIAELTQSLDEKIRVRESYELDGALEDKAMRDVRSFVKNQLSLPDILTGDFEGGKEMSTGQVVGILQQKFDIKQVWGHKSIVQQADKNIEIFGRLFDKDAGGLEFNENLLEQENLEKLKTHLISLNEDMGLGLNEEELTYDLEDMVSFMRGNVTKDSYDSIMTEYFARTANIGAAFDEISGSIRKASGTVLNPFEYEGLTGLIGKGGSEMLGKAYNAFIPLLDQALTDSALASAIQVSPNFLDSLGQALGEDSELYKKVTSDEFKDNLNNRYHGITGFLGSMQQMVRDALKAKEGGNIQDLLNREMDDGKTLGELLEFYDETKTATENDLTKIDLLKSVLTTNIGSSITLAKDPFIDKKGTDSQVYKSREGTYQRIDPKMTGFGALLMFSEYTMTSDDQLDARFFSEDGYGLQDDYERAVAAKAAAGDNTPLGKTEFLSSYIQGLVERTQASFNKDSVTSIRGGVNAMVDNALNFHKVHTQKLQTEPDSLTGFDRRRYDLITEYNNLVAAEINKSGIDADIDPLKNRLIEELVLTKIQEDNEKYGVFGADSISYLRQTALARSELDLGDTSTEGEVNNRLLEANNLAYNAYIRRLRRGQQTDIAEASFISSNKLSVVNNALSEMGIDPENMTAAQKESLLLIAGLNPGGSLLNSDEQAELAKALLTNTSIEGTTTTPLNQLQESSAGVAKMTGYLNVLNELYENNAPQDQIQQVTEQLRMFYSDAGINVDAPQKLHRIINEQQQQLNITQTQQKLNQNATKETLNNADQGIYKGISINHGVGLGLLSSIVSPLIYAGLSEDVKLDDRIYSASIDIMQSVAQTVSDDTRLTTELSEQNESVAAKMKYSRIRRNLKNEGLVVGGIQSVAQETLNMALSKTAYAAIDYVNTKTAITGQMSAGRAAATVGAEILSTVFSQGLSRTLTGGRASAEGGYVVDPITRLVKQYAEQIWQMVEEAQESMLDGTQEVMDTDENQNIDFEVSAFPGVFEWDVESGVIVLDQDSNPIPMELESSTTEQVELLQTVYST